MKLSTLSLLIFTSLLAVPSFAADKALSSEEDRGTVKMPDYVAIPHPQENSRMFQNSNGLVKQTFTDYDTDRDGSVSTSEWNGTTEDFARLDANDDGSLSPREMASYLQVGVDPFAEMDANHDNYLSPSEWREHSHSFRKFDTNKDGMLTRDEFYDESVE
jgi:Ca2+-binding EF-hand superfamily protein